MTKEDEHRLKPEKFRGLIRFRRNSFDASRRIIYILDVQRSSTRARIHSRNADLNISAIFFLFLLYHRADVLSGGLLFPQPKRRENKIESSVL